MACMMPCRPDTCSLGIASRTLSVPSKYITVITAPAARIARGTIRRASTISSPIVDALSTPPKAKAMVDQKMTSFSVVLGTRDSAVIGVADPNRIHAIAPNPIRKTPGVQPASAPTLVSHLPTLRPTPLRITASATPASETMMKYAVWVESVCHAAPPMNSALAAAKYRSPGKYGRFDPQYVQPVRNAANGPNARLLQT